MRSAFSLLAAFVLGSSATQRADDLVLVENGKPRAEIVFAEQPQRSVRLAAHELQTYVRKITGAKLPIANEPTEGVPVQVYVGRSTHTDRFKISPRA